VIGLIFIVAVALQQLRHQGAQYGSAASSVSDPIPGALLLSSESASVYEVSHGVNTPYRPDGLLAYSQNMNASYVREIPTLEIPLRLYRDRMFKR
jgi:hypothetical protein